MNSADKWSQNINKAMQEIDDGEKEKKQAISIDVPDWLPYVMCIAFGFFVANVWLGGNSPHPVNQQRDYTMGGKAALLIVAEDVQHYWDAYGELPDSAPSPLVSVLDVNYEKLSDDHYRLIMNHFDSKIVFDGRESVFTMEPL